MSFTRTIIIKALIAITLLFQLINVAWAAHHNCCPEDNPDCVMLNMAMGCTACTSAALLAKECTIFSEHRILTKMHPYTIHYISVNNNFIWRPPIT